jgi:hypothetical protein
MKYFLFPVHFPTHQNTFNVHYNEYIYHVLVEFFAVMWDVELICCQKCMKPYTVLKY